MNFQKLALSTLIALSTLATLSTSLHAQDSIGWDPGSRPGNQTHPRDPWGNGQHNESREIELQVNSYFQNQARLDLINDSYVRFQLQGKSIESVTITASTQMGRGQAQILVNGQTTERPQTVSRDLMPYTFRVESRSSTLGQSLRSLELEMRGNFYVEKVVFNVRRDQTPPWPIPDFPSQPQIEVVKQQINQVIREEGGLQLFRLFSLGIDRQGQALRRVNVTARALSGYSQVSLLKNAEQSSSSQYLGQGSTRVSFEVGGLRIGQDIRDLRLYFRGDVIVEEISLEIDRGGIHIPGPGPGPVLDTRIDQFVNQRLYETSGTPLNQLLRIDPRQNARVVSYVEITLRGANYGTRVSLCQVISRQMNTNCGAQEITQSGSQRIILSPLNLARLGELNLSVRMGMIDIERIVINLR